jgi:hypothetical protein
MIGAASIGDELQAKFGGTTVVPQSSKDEVPTVWIARERIREVLRYLKTGVVEPYKMLYDMTAIDERARTHRDHTAASDFTVAYHLLSFGRNEYVRLKVALDNDTPSPSQQHRHLAGGELVRTRSVGYVRDHLRGAPAPRPDPDAHHLGWPSPSQGPSCSRHGNGPIRATGRKARQRAGGAALPP